MANKPDNSKISTLDGSNLITLIIACGNYKETNMKQAWPNIEITNAMAGIE